MKHFSPDRETKQESYSSSIDQHWTVFGQRLQGTWQNWTGRENKQHQFWKMQTGLENKWEGFGQIKLIAMNRNKKQATLPFHLWQKNVTKTVWFRQTNRANRWTTCFFPLVCMINRSFPLFLIKSHWFLLVVIFLMLVYGERLPMEKNRLRKWAATVSGWTNRMGKRTGTATAWKNVHCCYRRSQA